MTTPSPASINEELILKKFAAREAKLTILRSVGNTSIKDWLTYTLPGYIILVIGILTLFIVGNDIKYMAFAIIEVAGGLMMVANGEINYTNARLKKFADLLIEEIEVEKLND